MARSVRSGNGLGNEGTNERPGGRRATRRAVLRAGGIGLASAVGVGTMGSSKAQSAGAWTERAPLPVAIADPGAGVLGGRLYSFGGFLSGEGLEATARTYRYTPRIDSWKRVQDMPNALWGPCGVRAGSKLFSFGGAPSDAPYNGTPPSRDVYRYTRSDGWYDVTAETGVRCPYRNWGMAGVYNPDDGLIYCMGGGTNRTSRESATGHGRTGLGSYDEYRIWTFDPTTERVVDPDLARMPEAKRWHTVALVKNAAGRTVIHAIGGELGTSGGTDSNLRFNPSFGTWREMTPAPRRGDYTPRHNPVIGGKVYLTHGRFWGSNGVSYALVNDRYDPVSDSFTTGLARPSHERVKTADGVIKGTLYVAGGGVKLYDQNDFHRSQDAHEAFTPA